MEFYRQMGLTFGVAFGVYGAAFFALRSTVGFGFLAAASGYALATLGYAVSVWFLAGERVRHELDLLWRRFRTVRSSQGD